jgi:F0F1-type ATP synthase assembly protein I
LPKKKYPRFGFATVGLEMGVALAIGVLGGRYLDSWLDTKPLFFMLGFVIGLGAAVKAFIEMARRLKKELDTDEPSPPDQD